jgi:hypothetical protein
MASNRKTQNAEQNIYKISVKSNVVSKARQSSGLGVFGLYKEKSKWHLTALAVERTREKLVSDRRGGVESEVVDQLVVTPDGYSEFASPARGLPLGTFETKKQAMNELNVGGSTRITAGSYIITTDQWNRTMRLFSVDRDEYHGWSSGDPHIESVQ